MYEIDDFITVEKGKTTCPEGYTEIALKTGCEYASKALGLKFVETDTNVRTKAMPNCWTDSNGNAYHSIVSTPNTNDVTQSSLICKGN